MNKDTIAGNWEQLKGEVKRQWGKLTDNDVTLLKGDRQKFLGKVQEIHGIKREEAEKKLKELEKNSGYSDNSRAA